MMSRYVGRGKSVIGIPSLVDLCVQTAIDNVRYMGNVGETDSHLLERILSHCTMEQLMHIENRTVGRDLSSITDKFWKRFYGNKFGAESVELVAKRMKQAKANFTWRQLYQAKLKDRDEAQKRSLERLTQLYKQEDARRQGRQVKVCMKAPPATKKRSFYGGFGGACSFSNEKSNIMKKAKIEYLNSQEMKNRVAMRKGAVQKSDIVSSSKSKGFAASSRFKR